MTTKFHCSRPHTGEKEHYDSEYEKEQGLSSKVNKKADRQRYKESFNQAPHSSFHYIPMVH